MKKILGATAVVLLSTSIFAKSVNLTEDMASIYTLHKGEKSVIERNQNSQHRLSNNFTKTSRECPPFCIQPMSIGEVETVGELELFEFVKSLSDDSRSLLLDVRTTEWHRTSTIPGSINLPFTMLKKDSKYISKVLHILGAKKSNSGWSFGEVQKLMIYSNGVWDAQATVAIESLIGVGYPANKILYYRGGMQSWQNLGLSTK